MDINIINGMEVIGKLGSRGKDAQVYEVVMKGNKNTVALKLYRKNKNNKCIEEEYKFLKKAYKLGVGPKVYKIDKKNKYITMERLNETLYSHIKKTGKMTLKDQTDLIDILEILDNNNIFHGDVSPSNFLYGEDGNLYILDFGMSQHIDQKFLNKHGDNPNVKLGITFFILRIREVIPTFEPKILLKKVHSLLKC